ncbi:hypothetical protein MtrunA17_Chr8g0381491 [Medicago truncatula]|uniref:Uncharacterized protein n=1 Tax=Medicago truncatula TaxID=3880 RepID=A0A396GW65_MEDTR|nr:hypothetical protein MtrunA17_Chr8g0381491 [Medicago truncatula]
MSNQSTNAAKVVELHLLHPLIFYCYSHHQHQRFYYFFFSSKSLRSLILHHPPPQEWARAWA